MFLFANSAIASDFSGFFWDLIKCTRCILKLPAELCNEMLKPGDVTGRFVCCSGLVNHVRKRANLVVHDSGGEMKRFAM